MAGHSKWAKVKHFKGAIDAKRAKIFAKLSREITIAARLGGGDPDLNPRLRMVLLKCRSANVPAENIERAIKRGTGEDDSATYEDLTYEVFGPGGVGLLVEASTDNRNRSASEIRAILTRNGGHIATPGAVSRMFQRKGQILIAKSAGEEDKLMELAIEAGAEDFLVRDDYYEILTDPAQFEEVHKAFEQNNIPCESAEVTWLPTLTTPVTDPQQAAAINRLIEALEDHDDVNEVFSNADFQGAAAEV
ncbi:MAG: YebC/PmpR family DNA-binding transcriptional regulator [Verrucomicrobia bacterium]|nr:MAG: YebC/PmpR family DNA-binding transcriptional regulator [Verrucomicrobiota bacterium]